MSGAISQYEAELAEVRTMLESDGFGLEVVGEVSDGLHLRLTVSSPDACVDCIVPKPVMLNLISQSMGDFPVRVGKLTYPEEAHEAGQ